MAIIPFADEDVADETSGVNVIDAAAGLAVGIGQTEKYFANSTEFRAVIPSLGRIDFGMMAFGAGGRGLLIGEFIGGIEVKDALAGVTNNGLLAGTDLVVGLRPEHDAAGHTLLIPNFRDAAATKLGHALVMPKQILVDAGANLIAFGSPLGQEFFVLGRKLAGFFFFFFDFRGFGF